MKHLLATAAVLLLLAGSHVPAHADDDHGSNSLPAPDFGWATFGVLALAAGATVAVRRGAFRR